MVLLQPDRLNPRRLLIALAFIVSVSLAAAGLAACDDSSSSNPTTVPSAGGSTTPLAGDPAKGQVVFARYCNACHPGGGMGAGPSLVSRVPGMRDSAVENAVRRGRGRMPAFTANQISDQELTDLVSFLRTLK